MKEIKRFDEIDILKSIGIILMVMGHIGFGAKFDYWIHAFHMPMFFIISGFLYNTKDISFVDYLKKKIKSLLLPYIIFATGHLCIVTFTNGFKFDYLKAILLFNTDNMPIAGALWFLTSLFFVDIMYYFINKNNLNIQLLLCIIVSMLGCVIPFYIRLPLALDTALVGLGLFFVGRIFKIYGQKYHNNRNILMTSLLFILSSLFAFLNGYINMRQGIYSNLVVFFIVATTMTISLYFFSQKLQSSQLFFKKELIFIGKNSLVYVVLNQLVILIITKLVYFIPHQSFILFFVCKIIILCFTFLVLHFIVYILNNKHFKWCLGKW